MKAATLWPAAVVGVLAVTVGANAALLLLAGDRSQMAIEPDYYRKALAWDSTQAQRGRDAALGWRLDAALEPAKDGARLSVRLVGPDGAPIENAALAVTAIHNLDAERPVAASLRPLGGGAYEALLPLGRPGRWELRFDARRGEQRFTAVLRRDLAREIAP